MGFLTFDSKMVEFDDRVIAHLQVVIVQRYRAQQPFLMSWLDPLIDGDGRSAAWMTPHVPVHFKFLGSRAPAIDAEWIRQMSTAAGSGPGLIICDGTGKLIRATSLRNSPRAR